MALTVTEISRSKMATRRVVVADVLFDSSYPTGGESLTAANFGLSGIEFLGAESALGYNVRYDHANSKIMVYTTTNTAAAHSHTENTAVSYTQNATSGTSGAITAAAGAQVANTTDLSALTVRVFVIGT